MKQQKTKVHFIDAYLLNPANPLTINLIGAGGTGSHMLTALLKINIALNALQRPGLSVRVFDDDIITPANKGRQLFADAEVGLHKAAALVNRVNKFAGTNWKAMLLQYNLKNFRQIHQYKAHITISCVDKVQPRFDIAEILKKQAKTNFHNRDKACYWMDFGNSRHTGQVILSTVTKTAQPKSRKFLPVAELSQPTDEFRDLFEAVKGDDTPSCSVAEALLKQDLFINPALADLGGSILWQALSEGMIQNRGFFLNLRTLQSQPLKVA